VTAGHCITEMEECRRKQGWRRMRQSPCRPRAYRILWSRGRDFASGYHCPLFSRRLNSEDIDYLPPWNLCPQGGLLRTQFGSGSASASGRWSQRPRLPLEVWRVPARWREPPNFVQHFRTQ